MPEVYALNFDLSALPGRESMEAMTAALQEWVEARCPGVAAFDFREPATIHTHDGNILRWEPFHEANRHLLDFTWRHFDASSRSISWSTRVAYLDVRGQTSLSIQVANTGPDLHTAAPLLTSRPRLLLHLADHFALRCDGFVCKTEPDRLTADDVASLVHYELFDPERCMPILLISPQEDGSYPVPQAQIAQEFLSLGKVYALDTPETTFVLTRVLRDRRLSCFNGALRAYLPGLKFGADAFSHPLLSGRRLVTAAERYRLAQFLAALTIKRFRRDPQVLELRDRRAIEREDKLRLLLKDLEQRRTLAKDNADWEALAELAWDENKKLADEIEDLRDSLRVAETKVGWLESERKRLMLIAREGSAAELEVETADLHVGSVEDAVEAASDLYGAQLFFLPSSFEGARKSPYRRPEEVYRALEALAGVADRLSQGALGTTPLEVFRGLGQDYGVGLSETTPRRLRQQYEFKYKGMTYRCEEHLKLGGGRDPATCLRIYFTSTQRCDGKIVVGHVGRHLDVIATD